MKTYLDQVGRILDPEKILIRYNSEWLDPIPIKEFVKLCAKVTVAQLINEKILPIELPISNQFHFTNYYTQ